MKTIYDLPQDTGKLVAVELAANRYASCRRDKTVKTPGEVAYIEEHKYAADPGVGKVLVETPSMLVPPMPPSAPGDASPEASFEETLRQMLGLPPDTPQSAILDLIRAASVTSLGDNAGRGEVELSEAEATTQEEAASTGDTSKPATPKPTASAKPATPKPTATK